MRLFTSIIIAAVPFCATGQGQVVNPANGHTYVLTPAVATFDEARGHAARMGGHLVAVNDAAEEAFLAAMFGVAYFMGLTDEQTEGVWRWDSGEVVTHTHWCQGGPGGGTAENHAVWLPAPAGCWDDVPGAAPGVGLVEIPPGTAADLRKVMITEVSWGTPDGLEVGNFGLAPVDVSAWTVRWDSGVFGIWTSGPLGITLASGEIVTVGETPVPMPGTPPGIRHIHAFPLINAFTDGIVVSLLDGAGSAVDEIVISDSAGADAGLARSGIFRGIVVRTGLAPLVGETGVERIWGLDTDSAADWTEQPNRSFGLRNRTSGLRSADPLPVPSVLINEVDDTCIELLNLHQVDVSLDGWFLSTYSISGPPHPPALNHPFPAGTLLAGSGLLVIGEPSAPLPAELPAGIPYLTASSSLGLGIGSSEVALYDRFGRLVDLVRTTGLANDLVSHGVSAPAHWSEFGGGARRQNPFQGLGRVTMTDTDQGTDFHEQVTRTMGSLNNSPGFNSIGAPGLATSLHLHCAPASASPGSANVIVNAGTQNAGAIYGQFLTILPTSGTGPFFGLGYDALANWLAFQGIAPLYGTLDAQGSIRYDLNAGALNGIQVEMVFYMYSLLSGSFHLTLVHRYEN